ncbi:unnamed protein product [Parnassius apollo]|uniref:(apollo) hypothetical protein n=1 Tax=Parnassius apollo TaxID=110799 RepID=A0A8S3XUM0_PARAO|nr:unnamed protein product [Parnassius apollo]
MGLTQYSTPNLCVARLSAGNRVIYIASVYIEPDRDESATLDKLDAFLKATGDSPKIVGGDFNGWHPIWGSPVANARGGDVVDLVYGNELVVCNVGDSPTFETISHGRHRDSIIDITLASESIYHLVSEWQVNPQICTSSQHHAIEFYLNSPNSDLYTNNNTSTFIYKSKKACWPLFNETLHLHLTQSDILDINISALNPSELDDLIAKVVEIIHIACRKSMRMRGKGGKYKPPWWSEELEAQKLEIIKLHHRIQEAKRRGLAIEDLVQQHMTLKAAYAQNLRAESTKSFRDFCSLQTKENVWSLTNRLLKESTARRPPTTLKINNKFTADNSETATALLNHFYPPDLPDTDPRHHELTAHLDDTLDTNDEPPFTSEEVLEHLSLMNPNKAPGVSPFEPLATTTAAHGSLASASKQTQPRPLTLRSALFVGPRKVGSW